MRDALGSKGTRLLNKWITSKEALEDPMPEKVAKLFYIIFRLLQNARYVQINRRIVCGLPVKGALSILIPVSKFRTKLISFLKLNEINIKKITTVSTLLCRDVLEGKNLNVFRESDSPERQLLMDIRSCKYQFETLKD